jgi:ABC-2 type transport system ATP-binding protein
MSAPAAVSIADLGKRYASGFEALKHVNLDITRGEIFALLGPNGAGKTTLISIVCGIVTASSGTVKVDGQDIQREYRSTRSKIGLVPQELSTDAFETVWNTVSFSRGLFGKPTHPGFVEQVLRDLSLWDKKDNRLMMLSGGMKRRVMIAKALSHEPEILFLDEPTAGVDVELRRDMWALVRRLRERGVTIILTTHYIEEAQEMADRVGVINKGELVVVDETQALMRRLGKRVIEIELETPLAALPPELAAWRLASKGDGRRLEFQIRADDGDAPRIGPLLARLAALGLVVKDIGSHESSLEDIFVDLVSERGGAAQAQR